MIVIETTLTPRAMTALARVKRKTLRRGRSSPVRLLAWFVVLVEGLLTAAYLRGGQSGWGTSLLLAAIMLAAILGEDPVNGALALRAIPPAGREVNAAFSQETCYTLRSQAGEEWWPYQQVRLAAETKDYFFLLLDRRRGHIFDKTGFAWGTPEEFRALIQKKTGQKVQRMR